MLQNNNSQSSCSDCYSCSMSENNEQAWRQKRLIDLAKMKGGNASLGRLLGYKDGAYVGQMIDGHRPITEKFIKKVQLMHGLTTWFDREPIYATVHTAQESWPIPPRNARECLDKLETILSAIDPSTREEIGDLLSHFARGLRPATKEAIVAVIDGAGKPEQQKAA